MKSLIKLILTISILLVTNCKAEEVDSEFCQKISLLLDDNPQAEIKNPSRQPNKIEAELVNNSHLELLNHTDYGTGILIVDIDNDGKEDLLVWNISGTGRSVAGEVYEYPISTNKQPGHFSLKFSLELGILYEPRFITINKSNYLLDTDSGDDEDLKISKINGSVNKQYQQQVICRNQTVVHAQTRCRHPACKTLSANIEQDADTNPFATVEWPHKYTAPAGISVYYPENGSQGDFDNTGQPTSIWRIGRTGYSYQFVNWGLLGLGKSMPEVKEIEAPLSDDSFNPRVLDGEQHNRLRRTLSEQSIILSAQLHRKIELPKQGQFFLFDSNNRTYWAWDFGEPPYGEEIHITYTNAKKSDYIGMVKVIRDVVTKPCKTDCIIELRN
ncbi:MAG: hypothetical protein CTY34_11845 [Methylobacter sp.]|nr:MAG: hypothetical protein CTY34_11845 [Methylobacter sp.]